MEKISCFECNHSFLSSRTLIQHIKFTHPFLPKYCCKSCLRTYKDLHGLRKHFKYDHISQTTLSVEKIAFPSSSNNKSQKHLVSQVPDILESPLDNVDDVTPNNIPKNDALSNIENVVSNFLTKLYSNTLLNRSLVQEVSNNTKELIDNIFLFIKVKFSGNEQNFQTCLDQCFEDVSSAFSKFQTEYFRFKYLENQNVLIKPKPFFIGNRTILKKISTSEPPQLTVKRDEGQTISLESILKCFLELPEVFSTLESFIKTEESVPAGILTSIFQGTLWKTTKQKFDGKNLFPIFLFFDDFEPLDALSSRAGIYKIGALYLSLACIPPQYASLLENIFLGQFFYSSDRKHYGNHKVFKNIIEQLIDLEQNGITININGSDRQVYFTLLLILGDNLGLHSVLGLTESFSATYFCRFCLTSKEQCELVNLDADTFIHRTKENYDLDCEELSHGIKEKCVWHQLSNFHLTQNLSCDIMHDFLEGIFRYSMANIIKSLISKKYFTLDHLNSRIKYFTFSSADAGNLMPQIKNDHLKNGQLIMSAAEMLSLCTYFSILVGDLIPEEEPIWDFYVMLVQILDILLSACFSNETIVYLSNLIKQFNYGYCKLFDQKLKPKFHIVTHYPDVIRCSGPPRFYWSMRFEAFHKLAKNTARTVNSRRNLLVTLFIKQQLKMSYRLATKKGLSISTLYGPSQNKPAVLKQFSNSACTYSWIQIGNVLYKPTFLLQHKEDHFAVIEFIIENKNCIFFALSECETIGFSHHFQAYHILLPRVKNNWIIIKLEKLFCTKVYNIHYSGNGECLVVIMK